MDFCLRAEPLPDEVRRVVLEQIDAALAELGGDTDDPQEVAVHEARKRLKRVRAVLRVVRDEVGERVYARENAAYRGAAQRLAGIRDARVLVNTLNALDGEAFAGPRAALVERDAVAVASAREAATRAIRDLDAARPRVQEWPLRRDGFAMLEGGLVRVYRQGRRRFARTHATPDMEHFHEWRKRVKDLWHVFQLLEASWPPVLNVLADQAHTLSDHLGDEHDLGVLAERVRTDGLGAPEERDRLMDLITARREELRADARLLGLRMYAEEPWDFVDRMAAYWNA